MASRKRSTLHATLSRRERQIMDALFRLGAGTAAEVRAALPDPPSDSSVRTHLRILEEKGHLTHAVDGPRFTWRPTVSRARASAAAARHLVDTFFDGSISGVVAALLETSDTRLSAEEAERLEDLIAEARRKGDRS